MALTFTAGVMVMLADASVPTRSCGTTSLVNSTRTGEWREMAPLLCWLIEVTHCGSGAATLGRVATLLLPLQLTNRKAAAMTARAGTRIRIMETPAGRVDRRSVSSTQDAVDRVPAIVANRDELWDESAMVMSKSGAVPRFRVARKWGLQSLQ